MTDTRWQFFRFACTGASSYLLNLLVLYAMTDRVGLHYLQSACVSLTIVTVWSFLLNRSFSFEATKERGQCVRHIFITSASFTFALAMMHVSVSSLDMHYLLANIAVSALMLVSNFLFAKFWVFTPRHQNQSPVSSIPTGSHRHT